MKTSLILVAFVFAVVAHPAWAADNELTPAEKATGWILLFDGKSLDEWMNPDGSPSERPIEQAGINPHEAGGYMLVHKRQWSNFTLRANFKIAPGCNSGIFIRTTPLTPQPGKSLGHNGIEFQIMDSNGLGYHDTGAFYDLAVPKQQAMRPVGAWNQVEIRVHGYSVTAHLNGVEVSGLALEHFDKPFLRPDGTSHKFAAAWKDHPLTGYIGLQDHGTDVWFKNIRIKEYR
ncbi:MAG: DUF1080 domain-containing protein [Acidobacteria bacterium]|nr:DUF1080 domain-containing protein [Acidobacteriota bacterium]